MNIFLANKTKHSIKAKCNSNEYFLSSNQTQKLSVNDNDKLTLTIINNTDSNSYEKKLNKALNNLVLNVSCVYLIKNLNENENIQITSDIFEFKENALLLPFAYHYLNAIINDRRLQLIKCKANNVKQIKKIYFVFAILGNGGFDFLLNIFSITFQMQRIKKLCNESKIFKTLNNNFRSELI